MTTFTVDMAVGHFFGAGVANVHDLHFEVQTLTSQWMVAVNGHVVAIQVTNGHDLHAAVRAGGVELHADFEFVDAFEHAAAQGADQFSGVFAVGIFRLDGDFQFVTNVFAIQRFFEAWNDVTGTLQVNQRRAAGGAVDDLTSVVGQGIVNGDSLIGGNRHGSRTFALD